MGTIRLAHISDVHITASPLGWEWRDWFNKRLPGWINFRCLGRGHRFQEAEAVLGKLVAELQKRRPDRIIFSGDATAMGFEAEFTRAAELLKLSSPDMPPGLAVPGNHDYYTRASAAQGLFERYFASWQTGTRVDGAIYPFAQRAGPAWLVAVNSAAGNRWAWDASGQVDEAQLDRLGRLLERLEPGPRILVTHYPVCLSNGRRERRTHGLRNLADVVAVAAKGGVCLWLHGHRHTAYQLSTPGIAPFPVVCAGSSTQTGCWGFNEYHIEDDSCRLTRFVYSPGEGRFREQSVQSLQFTR